MTVCRWAVLAVALGGCDGGNVCVYPVLPGPVLDHPRPAISVQPGRLALESAVGEGSEAVEVTVFNDGEGVLELVGLDLAGQQPDAFELANLDAVLISTGDQATFWVSFEPELAGLYSARIIVSSNDPRSPEEVVRIEAEGIALDDWAPR